MTLIGVWSTWVGIMACLVFMLYRNNRVRDERIRVIRQIGDLVEMESDRWRWEAYEEVTYEEMLLKFWKPISSFYENHRCLARDSEGGEQK